MTEYQPKLALGPVLYYWPKEKLLDFYERISAAPVDIVYLGETVCSKRRAFNTDEWLALAERLTAAGKEVVLSTMALLEAESELKTLRRLCENSRFTVEANDMGAVRLLSEKGVAFVLGTGINVYSGRTLRFLAGLGAGGIVADDAGRDPGRAAGSGGNRGIRLRPVAAGLFRPLLHRATSRFAQGRLPVSLSRLPGRADVEHP